MTRQTGRKKRIRRAASILVIIILITAAGCASAQNSGFWGWDTASTELPEHR